MPGHKCISENFEQVLEAAHLKQIVLLELLEKRVDLRGRSLKITEEHLSRWKKGLQKELDFETVKAISEILADEINSYDEDKTWSWKELFEIITGYSFREPLKDIRQKYENQIEVRDQNLKKTKQISIKGTKKYILSLDQGKQKERIIETHVDSFAKGKVVNSHVDESENKQKPKIIIACPGITAKYDLREKILGFQKIWHDKKAVDIQILLDSCHQKYVIEKVQKGEADFGIYEYTKLIPLPENIKSIKLPNAYDYKWVFVCRVDDPLLQNKINNKLTVEDIAKRTIVTRDKLHPAYVRLTEYFEKKNVKYDRSNDVHCGGIAAVKDNLKLGGRIGFMPEIALSDEKDSDPIRLTLLLDDNVYLSPMMIIKLENNNDFYPNQLIKHLLEFKNGQNL